MLLLYKLVYKFCRGGGIGRRAGLKIPFSQESAGSIPAPGTTFLIIQEYGNHGT